MRDRSLHLVLLVVLVVSTPFILGGASAAPEGGASLEKLKTTLGQAGFLVPEQDGRLTMVDVIPMCCADPPLIPSCVYNNVNAPYMGIADLPLAPGEPPVPLPFNFRLGQNEAIILVGKTPPPMAYFSYTVFLGLRPALRLPPGPNGTMLNSYIGDAVNNLTIHTNAPADPFNRQMLLIITADREVEARVRAAARKAGFPTSSLNTIVIPAAITHLGIDAMADTFWLLHRNALPVDEQANEDYIATDQPVLRVSLQDPAWQADPLPVPRLQLHGTGASEMDLVPALDALGAAIKAQHADMTATEMRIDVFPQGFGPLQREVNAMGPVSDALYLWDEEETFLLPTEDSFAVLYGVNHGATGKVTYSSLTLYEDNLRLGLETVFDWQFGASAQVYLPPDTPNADKLYVWKVAWHCDEGEEYCMEVANPGCDTLQLGFDSPFRAIFRLYLEPATKTGPDFREIVYDRVMVFTP